ncbi:MAG: LLM class flavin-dependent oxidoreductase [Armatimonadota bacterium]|nr:LLM class flavin-dependent oxidoreductase [Armatimonadota bacterium]MDR7485083.1 LLM class flavin-dependent oxidoreductase [Armatimonadota bacterium]MDR7537028.1 LLM class flavin-dependent oxidoreductase [Armatimonadota bacterium]
MRAEPVRTGFALGYDSAMPLREMAHWMQEADARGYACGFFSETINLVRDSVSALAVFAGATRRLRLGATQVVRLRTPIVMAQTLASLDELAEGRLVLAAGACTRHHARLHGLLPADPAVALREWVAAVRLLLTGERVSFAGQVVRLDNVRLAWTPPRGSVPVWIAATSRTGLRLAGEIGDGVLLNAVTSPAYVANAVRIVRQAVEEAGRDWARFEVAALIPTSIEATREAAVDAIRWEVASKFHPGRMAYNARIRTSVGEPVIDEADLPAFRAAFAQGGLVGLARAMPRAYVEGLTACGTADDVPQRIQAYRDAGVRLPLLRPAARHQIQRVLDALAPTR